MIEDIDKVYAIYSSMGYIAIALIVFALVYALVLRSMYRNWAKYVPGPVGGAEGEWRGRLDLGEWRPKK